VSTAAWRATKWRVRRVRAKAGRAWPGSVLVARPVGAAARNRPRVRTVMAGQGSPAAGPNRRRAACAAAPSTSKAAASASARSWVGSACWSSAARARTLSVQRWWLVRRARRIQPRTVPRGRVQPVRDRAVGRPGRADQRVAHHPHRVATPSQQRGVQQHVRGCAAGAASTAGTRGHRGAVEVAYSCGRSRGPTEASTAPQPGHRSIRPPSARRAATTSTTRSTSIPSGSRRAHARPPPPARGSSCCTLAHQRPSTQDRNGPRHIRHLAVTQGP
jgi:hypothetical protein